MGKKRGKEKSSRASESEDFTAPSCSHIRKGIDHNLLKKTVQIVNWNTCQDCKDGGDVGPSTEDGEEREAPVVWVCLRCGHRGCGRDCENQHAVKHYETPHSDTHCLVLSLDNWSVWCYLCDDDVQYSSTGQLAQLVSSIKKQALSEARPGAAHKKVREELRVCEEAQPATLESSPAEVSRGKQKKDLRKDGAEQEGKPQAIKASDSTVSVRGLSNLGNTCFFNAVVQNLSQTPLFRKVLKDILEGETSSVAITPDLSTKLEPISIQLDQPGSLTMAMCNLLNEIQETKRGVVTPRELFTQVCKKAARFKGFQQQDSQELLRYLLDGMRAEEMKRVSLGISEALRNSGKNTESEELKKLIKEYEKNGAPKNFVDKVFGGEMTSTIMCKECKTVSLVTEMFLDLSLPVADEAYRKKNQRKEVQKSSEEENIDPNSLVRPSTGDEDILSGVGSKYQQKKAKKQAKKQAKNQRRQQKLAGKVFSTCEDSAEPVVLDKTTEKVEGLESDCDTQGEKSEELPQNQQDVEEAPIEVEDVILEPELNVTSSTANRFTALSEDRDKDGQIEDEGNDGETTLEEEEDGLTEALSSLSLNRAFIAPDDIEVDLESKEVPSCSQEYTVVNQDPELAFHTLAPRVTPEKQECSVQSCLYQFTEVENLTKNNSLLCVACSKRQSRAVEGSKKGVYTDGLKQMLVSLPPPVLTLHLKRFQQVSYSLCKVNRHIQFPHVLDLAPFCSVNCKNVPEGETRVLYGLYGVVEHSGTMRSGHYTAYVKARPFTSTAPVNGIATPGGTGPARGLWYHVSDTCVQPVPESKVLTAQAYLLFYERVS